MKKELNKFTITVFDSILTALKKIDSNQKGFLIVVEKENTVLGTLTDGDIRRAFINGHSVDSVVKKVYKSDFISLNIDEGMSRAIDLFKNNGIKFLPIINESKNLVNIITKSQMHSLLLQDISANLMYDFFDLDENIVNHEIFPRPWGFYKTTVYNEYFQSKVISVNPMSQLSLQSHSHREEHWVIVHGVGKAQVGDSVMEVKCGSYLFIPKGCKHRLSNVSSRDSLIVSEVQIGDYLGEDDIVRYEDIYGREVRK